MISDPIEKQIDSAGKTISYTKTTVDPAGSIVRVKDKIGGGTFWVEASEMDFKRQALLETLRVHGAPLELILHQLRQLPWDSEEACQLGREHLSTVLQKFVRGGLTSEELASWGEAIECRDDIEMDEELREIVWRIANPDLAEPFTREAAVATLSAIA